jgi:hypothetical protein
MPASQRPMPSDARLAEGVGHHAGPRPEPPGGLQVEPSVRATSSRAGGEISEHELCLLLGDACTADSWANIQPAGASVSAPPPSRVLADCAADSGQAQAEGASRAEPGAAPPDIEPSAAKEPERQLTQTEIDALLARLLGG